MKLIYILACVLIPFAGFGCQRVKPTAATGSVPAVISSRDPPIGPEAVRIGGGIELHLGVEETLLADGALGLHYMPDIGVGIIDNEPGKLRLVFAAGWDSYLVEGTDFKHLAKATRVLSPTGKATDFDNGDAGISQVIRAGDRLFAIYHAEDHLAMPTMKENSEPGFYAGVGLVESEDNGQTWIRRGQIIKSDKPKEFKFYPEHNTRGNGLPGAVNDPTGRYAYVYYTDMSPENGHDLQVCMARADLNEGPPLPGRWRKYYQGQFREPGIGGKNTPVLSAVAFDESQAMYPHVTWSEYLKNYVMVFNVNCWKEAQAGKPPVHCGIYWATSADAIQWSEPVKLVTDYPYQMPGKSMSTEPTVIFDDRVGRTGWLVYEHSPKWVGGASLQYIEGGVPHYMVGRRLEIRRREQ
jgi:hypothetical protein